MTPLLTRIREKVIQAVPEIMDLQFGFRLLLEKKSPYAYGTVGEEYLLAGDYYATEPHQHLAFSCVRGEVIDIGALPAYNWLGRTIHLADVLAAIEWERPLTLGRSVGVDGNEGLFMLNETTGAKAIWNLRKDSIEDQTIEVQEFLGEILGV